MRTMWVKKRVCLEAPDEQALGRSIGTFEAALRVRSGTILKLQRERRATPSGAAQINIVKISYALPIEYN